MYTITRIVRVLSRKERLAFSFAVVLFGGSGVVLLGLSAAEVTALAPAFGGNYTEGMVGQPAYVNPVIAASDVDKALTRLIFSNLTELAEKMESTDEGRTWVVRLKESVAWHDGEELTTDDVIFTIQKIQDPDSRSPLAPRWQGILTERVSERELRFNLGTPYAFFEENLRGLYVLPKHLFENIPVANWRISEFNLKPVGSGPYAFEGYKTKSDGFVSVYRLGRNDAFFAQGPFIRTLNFHFYNDKTELLRAFNNGAIDSMPGLEAKDLGEIARPYHLFRFSLPNYYAVFWNQSQNIALKELEVRKALSRAVRRTALVRELFGDALARAASGLLPPHVRAAAPFTQPLSIEEAGAILEGAGWTTGEDGFRRKKIKKDTVALEITLTTPRIPFLSETAQILASTWQALGVKVHLVHLPLSEMLEGPIKNREYQAVLFGNILAPHSDLFSFWHSSQRFFPGLNLSLYSNPDADAGIEAIRETLDPLKRKKILEEVEEKILADYPAVFLYAPYYLYVASRELHGVTEALLADPADRFREAPRWYVKTKIVLK